MTSALALPALLPSLSGIGDAFSVGPTIVAGAEASRIG